MLPTPGHSRANVPAMKTLGICSASPVLSQGLQSVLVQDFRTIGIFPSITAAQTNLNESPDLLVIDMSSPITREELLNIGTMAPNIRIVLWIDTVSKEFLFQCLASGVRGVLPKSASVETHVRCMRQVADGEIWIDEALSRSIRGAKQIHLTPRERQVVSLIVQGLSNKEIAWSLGISEGTIKVYMSRLYVKVGVGDRFELALLALKNIPASSGTPSTARRQGEPAKPFAFPDIIRMIPDRDSRFLKPSTPQLPGFGLNGLPVAGKVSATRSDVCVTPGVLRFPDVRLHPLRSSESKWAGIALPATIPVVRFGILSPQG
jgi:DNA-binding NarL/FixJ family response regulator